jgi:preprotein translocase subunit SecA
MLQMLLEVKEGCRTSARREVVARISVPAFLGRYLHLAGVCADARGLETELWTLYGLKTALAGTRAPAPVLAVRVFAITAQKNAAVFDELRAQAGRGWVIAVRTPAGAKAAEGLVADAGIESAAIARYGAPPVRPRPAPASVLVLELHDARRHLAQLCALHGASACKVFLALDEEAMVTALGAGRAQRLARFAAAGGELPPRLSRVAARLAQRGAERAQAALRQEIASRDQYLRDLLAFSGEGE